jgi:hypothetical protein
LKEFIQHAYPDELRVFADLNVREGKAIMTQANMIRMVMEREATDGAST